MAQFAQVAIFGLPDGWDHVIAYQLLREPGEWNGVGRIRELGAYSTVGVYNMLVEKSRKRKQPMHSPQTKPGLVMFARFCFGWNIRTYSTFLSTKKYYEVLALAL